MIKPDKIGTDFKLLAIRPRKGCHPDFRKVLKEGEIYRFYQDYEFKLINEKNPNSEIEEINYYKTTPDNLFDLTDVQVNVSAIVGKNGSGKSTVSELFFYVIYYWGIYFNQVSTYYELLENDKAELESKENRSQDDEEDLNRLEQLIPFEKDRHQFILKNFRASIFYQFEGKIIELKIGYNYKENKNVSNKNFETIVIGKSNRDKPLDKRKKNLTDHFFYSLALNYSQFALNGKIIGNWVTTLFHKNDAYQLPISINPMRTDGNFDINKELSLAKYRLLHNLLIQYKYAKSKSERVWVSDNQFVKNVHFYFNPDKIKEVKPLKRKKRDTYPKYIRDQVVIDAISVLSKGLLDEALLDNTDLPFKEEVFDYIFQKVVKISRTYPNHKRKLDFGESTGSLENREFFDGLKKDDSHITFKLKQAVNFLYHSLKNRRKRRKNRWPENELKNGKPASFTLKELSEWINFKELELLEIINHIPPSLFRIEIMLSSNDERGESSFDSLSSGEQQLIHSVQSVLYHLNNINSVFDANDERKRYKAVNIMYDEIELYFHPEYQRQFLDRLMDSIEKLTIKNIRYINILFSTHSPFILSDIPGSNLLCLEKGNPVQENRIGESFAANVHDLLANEFFMRDSFMGEYAKKKIEQCIMFLNYHKTRRAITELEKKSKNSEKPDSEIQTILRNKNIELENLQEIASKRAYAKNFFNPENSPWYRGFIDLVGEPVLKTKLRNMHAEVLEQTQTSREIARQKLLQLAQEFNFKIDPNNIE